MAFIYVKNLSESVILIGLNWLESLMYEFHRKHKVNFE